MAVTVITLSAVAMVIGPDWAAAQTAPFAAVQFGTNGCIEVGARPDPPYNQPKPFVVPASYDVVARGYPAFGYDPAGFIPTSGTNACRYNFRNDAGVTIGSGYCVQWAEGQRSGTGYDPEPYDGTIRNAGYVRRIVQDYWPATNAPAVPSTNATVINRQRSGTVAMAIHYFTDGIVLPPNYQDAALYDVTRQIVTEVLAAGPLPAPTDPNPTIDGPNGGDIGVVLGPYTIGANASGDVTVDITGGEAFTDAAATQPFTTGSTLAPGGQLWIRAAAPGDAVIHVAGPVLAEIGTMMVGDPTFRVQRMFLAVPLVLTGESTKTITVQLPPDPPQLSSRASATLLEAGGDVFDTLTVAGLDEAATVTVTLYGPLPPELPGGCAAVGWSGAPSVAAFGPNPITGTGDLVTPTVGLADIGCYTFGALLERATGPPIELPPGDPDETFLVIPRLVPPPFDITSQASSNVVDTGSAVSDHVTVTGFPSDRTIALVTILYGPVSPDASGSCATVDWTTMSLPVASTFDPVTLIGGGFYDTPAVRLDQPGCYSFAERVTHNLLTGGEEPVDHDIGVPAEVVRVLAAPAPSSTTSTTTTTTVIEPTTTTSPTPTTTTPRGNLPATGSGPSPSTTGRLAAILLLTGVGLAALASHRRSGRRSRP